MPNGTYGGVRGRKTKVGRKLLRFPPTRLNRPNPLSLKRVRRIQNKLSSVSIVLCTLLHGF